MAHESSDHLTLQDLLAEARTLMATQHRIARRTLRVSVSFRLIAYAIGFALLLRPFGFGAPTWLAVTFGFALIVATFLSQHFRPDVKFVNAKGRVLQLRRAIATGEARLELLEAGEATVDEIPGWIASLTHTIDKIERAHHLDYAMMQQPIVSSLPTD